MVIRSPKDFWAGLLFVGLGVLAITVGSRYALGTAARMGPATSRASSASCSSC
jgi:putative tricarboxylic transport membrane protein